MRSITTCVANEEVARYGENIKQKIGDECIDLVASFKQNGHACRVVYRYGKLINASTRGRYKKGRNITRQLSEIVPTEIEYFEDFPIVEVRGELVVKLSDFDNVLRNSFKTPLSSVTSLVRESVTAQELKYLHFVAYKIFILADEDSSGTDVITSLAEEFEYIKELGFEVPYYKVYKDINPSEMVYAIQDIIEDFEVIDNKKLSYDTDGIVVAVNDNETFYNLGLNKNAFIANIAIKMGKWECVMYSSIIEEIVFERGKSWFTPKAHVRSTVTSNGSSVTTVPLYNVGVMRKLGLCIGKEIFFRYGGETGVQLLTPDGRSVTEI